MNDIVAPTQVPGIEAAIAALLGRHSANTRNAYQRDLWVFSRFMGLDDVQDACKKLLAGGQASANLTAMNYVTWMKAQGHAPATVNRRLAALKSLLTVARMAGICTWTIDTPGMRAKTYRDVQGPGEDGFQRLLAAARKQKDLALAARDEAILLLIYGCALRRFQLAAIDLAHVDLVHRTLRIPEKGQDDPVEAPLSAETVKAIERWLVHRRRDPGPLFFSSFRCNGSTRFKYRKRLDGGGVYRIIVRLGNLIKLKVWPHGLKHAAITSAANKTGGDIRAVQAFSRHKRIDTVMRYIDAAKDDARKVADKVTGGMG